MPNKWNTPAKQEPISTPSTTAMLRAIQLDLLTPRIYLGSWSPSQSTNARLVKVDRRMAPARIRQGANIYGVTGFASQT
jgi:hypothetical protein